MKWEPSVGPSARVVFGVTKNKGDAYFLHSKFKTLMKQAPLRIKTHLAHEKQANKPEENKNGNQDALSHHHQLLKVLSGLLSVVDGVVPSI